MPDLFPTEAFRGGEAGRLLVVIAAGAEQEHAVDVGPAGTGEVGQGAESARVLHRGGHEVAAALSIIGHPVVGPGVQQFAVPIGAGGEGGADEHRGRLQGFRVVGVAGAEFADGRVFDQRSVLGQRVGPVQQVGIELVAVVGALGGGHQRKLIGFLFADRDVAGFPVRGHLAGVDLVPEVALDSVVRPDGRADGGVGRVEPGDTGNEPVAPAQVEARIEPEGHGGGGGVGVAHAGDDRDHGAVGVGPYGMGGGGQAYDPVELLPLHPELKLPRDVAGVCADLEHGYDHDFRAHDGFCGGQSGRQYREPGGKAQDK